MASSKHAVYFALLMVLFAYHEVVTGEMVRMKIVDEPSSYGLGNNFGSMYQPQEEKLTLRVQAANFSGPAHLRRLAGKCFSMVDEHYKYEFCPFRNITQHEQSLRWNPYSGVLGVFQEWEIVNNTFTAMMMKEGDACGKIFRSVKVFFRCGNHSHIANVQEPATCQYHLDFNTPLVCHNHSMLVYPIMSEPLQQQWDALQGELLAEEVTIQGYNKKLRKLFEKAGYCLSAEKQKILAKASEIKNDISVINTGTGEFPNIYTCSEEVTKLRAEIEHLREALVSASVKARIDASHQPVHNKTRPH